MILLLKFITMKKIYALIVLTGLFLNSCGKKEEMVEYTPLISGTWKLSKIAVISGKDGNIISSVTAKDCALMNTYDFNLDNSLSFKIYSGTGCTLTETKGNYDYQNSPSVNKLVLKLTNPTSTENYIVQKISELELQFYSTPLTDANNDGVLDKTVTYMHR
jgi:hypothetical protein